MIDVPGKRFDHLKKEFPNAFESIEIDSSLRNPHGIPVTAHSVLTLDFVDQKGHPTHDAWLKVVDFLENHLKDT